VDVGADDVVADLQVVERELQAYGHGLSARPRLVVLNKADVLDRAGLEVQVEKLAHQCGGSPPLVISAAASRGLDALLAAVWRELGIS
jgi:GTP-binding protein